MASPCLSKLDKGVVSTLGYLTSHQERITSTKASRKPRCCSSVEELMTTRDRSQIPGRAERARIVFIISVQLAVALQTRYRAICKRICCRPSCLREGGRAEKRACRRSKQGQRGTAHVTLVLQVTLLSWPYGNLSDQRGHQQSDRLQ